MSAKPGASMSVLDHIAELRRTLIWSFALALVAAIVAWFFSDQIIDALLRPAREAGQSTLYFQAPMEAFLLKLKASAVVGLMLVLPIILLKIYQFVLPGLTPREKALVTPLLASATTLFYVGVAFCYLLLLPLVVRFALGFATEHLQPWITASSYFDMAARLCLAFGLLFELPVVIFALSWVGVVNPRTLLKGWRYALILILAASATLTPPDVISQIMLAVPVMLLYLLSVLISIGVRRRRDRVKAETEARERAEYEAAMAADRAERARSRAAEQPPDAPADPRPERAEGTTARGEPVEGEHGPDTGESGPEGPERGGGGSD